MEKALWDGIMESLKEDEPNYDQPTLCMVTFGQSQLSHLFFLFFLFFYYYLFVFWYPSLILQNSNFLNLFLNLIFQTFILK